MADIEVKLRAGMTANGITGAVQDSIVQSITAFALYGFPESHAASFALIVYASAYLRHYYAPEFLAAMLNAQPMGFYSVGTLIEDARRHGVRVRPVDLTRSAWDHTLECPNGLVVVPHDGRLESRVQSPESRGRDEGRAQNVGAVPRDSRLATPDLNPSVRLGLRLVRGLGAVAREKLERALEAGPFHDIADVVRRAGLDQASLRALCEAGAFDRMVADVPRAHRRRTALWRVLDERRGDAGPLAPRRARPEVKGQSSEESPGPPPIQPSAVSVQHSAFALPPLSPLQLTDADYRMTGLSLNGHPMRHLRALLAPNGVRLARDLLRQGRDGERVAHAGLVICRQRPGTAKGFVFLSLEDESGILNVVVTPKRFERQALLISTSPLLLVRGTLQVERGVVNLKGETFRVLRADAGEEWAKGHDFR